MSTYYVVFQSAETLTKKAKVCLSIEAAEEYVLKGFNENALPGDELVKIETEGLQVFTIRRPDLDTFLDQDPEAVEGFEDLARAGYRETKDGNIEVLESDEIEAAIPLTDEGLESQTYEYPGEFAWVISPTDAGAEFSAPFEYLDSFYVFPDDQFSDTAIVLVSTK